jgi:hypothetical protein
VVSSSGLDRLAVLGLVLARELRGLGQVERRVAVVGREPELAGRERPVHVVVRVRLGDLPPLLGVGRVRERPPGRDVVEGLLRRVDRDVVLFAAAVLDRLERAGRGLFAGLRDREAGTWSRSTVPS